MLEQVIFFTILLGFFNYRTIFSNFYSLLKRLKFGQSIREEGPKSHQKKTGTPTMGGVMILLSIIITTLVMTGKFSVNHTLKLICFYLSRLVLVY